MQKETRNLIQRATQDARRVLERDYREQLEGIYDIMPDTGAIAEKPGDHLDARQRFIRTRMIAAIQHEQAKTGNPAEAVQAYLREAAFTTLNRFAALKLMEARKIVLECISKGEQSAGFREFTGLAPGLSALPDHGYRLYLECLFDEIGTELGVLFDRRDPPSLLWPRRQALTDLLDILNRDELTTANIWVEDETIGWIYQYFNGDDERKQMRAESAAPRNSRELAVRNQFFTPRYVVCFLTDNTLGRIWYEMTQGATKLKEQCQYMVRRPAEIFLKEGEPAPSSSSCHSERSEESLSGKTETLRQAQGDKSGETTPPNLSQEELLKQPVYIPHRPLKDPRTIRMLDPACGSMHFGLYSFDLFEVIYEEAWDLEETVGTAGLSRPPEMKSLHEIYASKEEFRRQVPRLIIENNLHGIDIDPRCAQIAGLSLWLRAQKSWQQMNLKAADRPRITRSNIVCAEPMPGEKELLREFVEQQFPVNEQAVFLRLLEIIFDKMQLAGEAGSLLKIEEEIRTAVEEAREAWTKLQTKPRELFSRTALNKISKAPELSGLEEAVSQLGADRQPLAADFWEDAEQRIYSALREYAERAENGGGFQRRLFAEDAARGFALIDICRKRYDVALMNPPFGDWSVGFKHLAKHSYPNSYCDILAAFIERGGMLLHESGRIGAITSRTCFFLTSFETWRKQIVLSLFRPKIVADLGLGVMDGAMVEAAAYVMSRASHYPEEDSMSCFRLLSIPAPENKLLEMVCTAALGGRDQDRYDVAVSAFSAVPGVPFSYWVTESIRRAFGSFPSFEPTSGVVRVGTQTSCDERFVRSWWEVDQNLIIRDPHHPDKQGSWVSFSKGGGLSRFYCEFPLVVNWHAGGREIKEFNQNTESNKGGHWSRNIRSTDYYFTSGLTWAMRASALGVCTMPSGCIFSTNAYGCFPTADALSTLAILASRPSAYLIDMMLEREGFSKFVPGVVQRLPFPTGTALETLFELRTSALSAWQAVRCTCSAIETSNRFFNPSFSGRYISVAACLVESENLTNAANSILCTSRDRIDDIAFSIYGFTQNDRTTIQDRFPTQDRPDTEGEELTEETREDSEKGIDIYTRALCQYLLGVAYGRWDVRYAMGEKTAPELPDPFVPLPVCPPGMLQNAQGFPAEPKDVPASYPIAIPWDGILVDDAGHDLDIENRVRSVLKVIWKDKADAIEQEAGEILGVKSLREYFRNLTSFFANHLKCYSKSRRQAPIYWPFSTRSGSYTIWLYYHRFNKDTFYRVQELVDEKFNHEERRLTSLRQEFGPSPSASQRKQLAEQETFVAELREFKGEVARVAPLWNPDLNDGVIINFAPLWRMIAHRPWQKSVKECWETLVTGDYDWAHLAMHLWPERVVPKCQSDRSLAIAHELDEVFWEEDEDGKPQPKKVKKAEVEALIEKRTSPAVKTALNALLQVPVIAPPPKRTKAPVTKQRKPRGQRRPADTTNELFS